MRAGGELERLGHDARELAAHPVDPVSLVARQERQPGELRGACGVGRGGGGVVVQPRPRGGQRRARLVEIDDGVGRQPQPVSAPGPLQQLAGAEAAGGDDAAHVADDPAPRGRPRVGQLLRPERVRELVAADVATMLSGEKREEDLRAPTRERGCGRNAAAVDREPSE